jgi:hypothetical protein
MTTDAEIQHLEKHGLYSSANEHDACGLGFVAHIKGEKRHDIVTQALNILENIAHRGAVGADKLMGDGAGILIQIPDALYREEMSKQGVTLPLRRIRRRHDLPAQGTCLAHGMRAGDGARNQGRGPGPAGLARRAGQP